MPRRYLPVLTCQYFLTQIRYPGDIVSQHNEKQLYYKVGITEYDYLTFRESDTTRKVYHNIGHFRVPSIKKGGRRFHLLLSKRWHLLPPFMSNEPGTGTGTTSEY
jgi:hypothetical protein